MTASIGDIPHVSLGVFNDDVDPAALDRATHELAADASPVALRLGPVEVFDEPQPVVYLKPDPSSSLNELHERFLGLLGPTATFLSACYRSEYWQPHRTIAMEFQPDRPACPRPLSGSRSARYKP